MESPIGILIVEDEMIIATLIALQLTSLGYEVTGIIPRAEDALLHIRQRKPDMILLDINLNGEIDGIEMAHMMQKEIEVPIIYISANTDLSCYERAKATRPFAFISKPFRKIDLQRAIELAIIQVGAANPVRNLLPKVSRLTLNDSIFVRYQDKMVRMKISEISYIEAERNYCRIYTADKEFLMVLTLQDLAERLPSKEFIQIHRSYIVCVSRIDEIATTHVVVGRKSIPVSRPLKEELLKRLHTI